ncbi:MAG TPA: wax ester/triacylglycerol synthase family O-acyltransferase [Burkholderiaceae bacterium]|nr:wax ester/triacylglycerol synthase family O-acyltransferase [Burkholderiaceae bacterium]
MASYPMSAVDAAWYHMDGPSNLAMVTGLMVTKEPLDFKKVRAIYRERIVRFDRFRQRVVESGFPIATPHWVDMPHFDVDQHIHHLTLPAPHDEAALNALIVDIASTPLDREQPLWQVHIVDNVDGGSAVFTRFHHCIADGTAMMHVIQHLFDPAPGPVRKSGAPAAATAAGRPARGGLLTSAFDAIEGAARRTWAAAGVAVDAVAHPRPAIEKAALVLRGAEALLTELVKWPDPKSPFKGEFGMRKHVAWSKPVAIKDVKEVGARSGAKVNDVLVAAMTGALRTYLRRRGVDVDHTTVRAMVPVDLRPPERAGELGNDFGLVILDLAVSKARAATRLALTQARMDALKRSPEPIAMRFLFEIFGRGPKAVEDVANDIFGSKASLVMTNVAGPKEPLFLAGVPIERMMFWVPHPGRQLGMGISIMSYRGMASLAVIADARLVPDPEKITEEFDREFDKALRSVRAAAAGTAANRTAAKATKASNKAVKQRAAAAKVAGRKSAPAGLPSSRRVAPGKSRPPRVA